MCNYLVCSLVSSVTGVSALLETGWNGLYSHYLGGKGEEERKVMRCGADDWCRPLCGTKSLQPALLQVFLR